MQILFGVGLCLFFEGLAWLAWKVWHDNLPHRRPQPRPRTPAQLANQAAYEAQEANTPRVVSMRVQRRIQRGRRRPILEDDQNSFEG